MHTLLKPPDRDQILSRLQGVRPVSQRRWGKMTAHQMICHLRDGYKLYMGLITAARPGFPYPSRLLKWGCLWTPIPWPKGFKTVPEVDQQRRGPSANEFDRDMAELRDLLKRFTTSPREFRWPEHPYLGRMSEKEWMRLGYLHADDHLRQFGA